MAERLGLMQAVAAYKWLHQLPIADPDREALVVRRAVEDGLNRGLTPATSAAFFKAQISAAREIQSYWQDRWQHSAAPTRAPNLEAEIRPRLLALGGSIIDALAAYQGEHDANAFAAQVDTVGLTPPATAALFEALAGVRRFPNRLDQVLATGVLRIGTTGDYEPFSLAIGDGYRGIDIDLGRDLAVALGVEARFVPTSWPTLIEDLEAGRYDLAMSGVSRTFARQRVGLLSMPYFVGGKTAIVRCRDAERFRTLADVDSAGVRVIFNPGGTNEAFVREHIGRAERIRHQDNRTVFNEILAGGADVMITDRIEVQLQTRRHPELCAPMANLSYQEKGYLLPRDPELAAFVDLWLSIRMADGTVAANFERHLAAEERGEPLDP